MKQGRVERAWELVRAHLEGDLGAFPALVDEHSPLLRYLCAGRPNAQDAIDETWYQVLRRIEEGAIAWHRRFSSWIAGLCLNVLRSKAMRVEASGGAIPTITDATPDPAELVAAAELHVALDDCLRALENRLRRIYELHYREAMPLVRVAATFDCSEANVRQKLLPKLHRSMQLCLARKGFRDWGSIPQETGTNLHG